MRWDNYAITCCSLGLTGYWPAAPATTLSSIHKKPALYMNISTQAPALNPLRLIDKIIAEIELSPTQYATAKRSYEAVAEVLNKEESSIKIFHPSIFPQGSIRIGTTIKPVEREEFDLDMVCWLGISGKHATAEQVYELVWKALGENATYRAMRERMCRCIRLNYSDSFRFHLDVTPAIPDWNQQSELLYVPDRTRKMWCSSHPIGFADSFFKLIARKLPVYERELTESVGKFSYGAAVEPLPSHGAFDKTPLQRIVQMLKHDRDKYFQDQSDLRPSSILLTTLSAKSYDAAVAYPCGSLLSLVRTVIVRIPNYIDRAKISGRTRYVVLNPVNLNENFAERWTEQHYNAFMSWHGEVCAWLAALEATRGRGVDKMLTELQAKFDDKQVKRAANSLGADTRFLHESGKLRMDNLTGKVGMIGSAIPKTINFGGGEN
jgi:hypothetical protein